MSNVHKMVAVLGAVVVAVVAIFGYLIWSGYQEAIHSGETVSRNYAATIEAHLDATLRRAEAHVLELARDVPIAALSKAAVPQYAPLIDAALDARRLNFPELVGLRIWDVHGDLIYASESKTTSRINAADRDYFIASRENTKQDVFFSAVVISRITGRPAMFIARALRDSHGEFRGVVTASVELDYFQKLFQALDVGANGVISIFRRDNFTLVVRSPAVKGATVATVPPGTPTRDAVEAGKTSGTMAYRGTIDGVMRIFSFRTLERYPFYINVGIARDDALAGWQVRSLTVGAASFVLLLLLSALLFRLLRAEMKQAQAAAALTQTEARARLILDSSMDALIGITGGGAITEWSAGAQQMFGYSSAEALGKELSALIILPALRESHSGGMLRFLESGEGTIIGKRTEFTAIRKDGSEFPVELSVTQFRRDDQLFFSAFVRDISNRKQAQSRLQLSEIQLTGILESTADGILAVDDKGKVIRTNGRFAELWHIPQSLLDSGDDEALLSFVLGQLVDPDAFVRKVRRLYASSAEDMDILAFKDGRYFERHSSPLIQNGGILGRVWSFRDITERKQAETARTSLEAQLRESQKMQAIGTLAGGIAHDFNNIIAIILGNVELARRDVAHIPAAMMSLEQIQLASARARDLVRQILAFSRRQSTTRKPLDLAAVVDETARLLRATLPARLTLDVRVDPDLPLVLADATQMQQAIINITTNAAQAMANDPAGRISIRLDSAMIDAALVQAHPVLHSSCSGTALRLAISDSGPGMDAATLGRVFDPFFTTKPAGEGTGLGLSVVHGIVQSHEAAITVASEPGHGATFTLYIPVTKSAADSPASKAMDGAAPLQSGAEPGPHVVYIDDDVDVVIVVKGLLERRGCRVSVFTDPHEALQRLRTAAADVDLLLTDYNMPGMSGLDVARAVRDIRAELPVAVMSGFIDETLQSGAEAAGVRELIFKADPVELLYEAVLRLTRSHQR